MIERITAGGTIGILANGQIHVLKWSSSSYGMWIRGIRYGYCCQDGCCDRGLRDDVRQVVEAAKAKGAERVVLRTGQRDNYVREIAGLPVSDVSDHCGRIDDSHVVRQGWG